MEQLHDGSDHRQRTLQPGDRYLDSYEHVAHQRADEAVGRRSARFQLDLHDDALRRAWVEGADPPVGWYAWSDGEASKEPCRFCRIDHRKPHPLELQRR